MMNSELLHLIICDLKRSLYTSMYSECIMICILKIAITYNDLFFVAQLKRICSNKCKDINAWSSWFLMKTSGWRNVWQFCIWKRRDGMKGSRKLSRKVHSFLIQYFLLRVYCISLRQELLIQNRKVQHSLNLRDAKFFPSGEPTNSPFIERFCRRQKD